MTLATQSSTRKWMVVRLASRRCAGPEGGNFGKGRERRSRRRQPRSAATTEATYRGRDLRMTSIDATRGSPRQSPATKDSRSCGERRGGQPHPGDLRPSPWGSQGAMIHAVSPAVPALATQRVRQLSPMRKAGIDCHRRRGVRRRRYRDNPVDRCYFCKTNLYERIRDLTPYAIASGANLDDLGDYRPGLLAAAERNVVHPFIEAGMAQGAIRELARREGLHDISELPAQPCLASRVETGIAIDAADLIFVERRRDAARRHVPSNSTLRCRIMRAGVVIEVGRRVADFQVLTEIADALCEENGRAFVALRVTAEGRCSSRGNSGFQIDWDREARTGLPEAVFCARKIHRQIGAIIAGRCERGSTHFCLTRLGRPNYAALPHDVQPPPRYEPLSSTILGGFRPADHGVGIVAAGTSDIP